MVNVILARVVSPRVVTERCVCYMILSPKMSIYLSLETGDKPVWPCADYINGTIADGEIVVKESAQCSAVGATFDKNAIQLGGKTHGGIANHKTGWNNQFALGYELGMYYNFTLEGNN